jgi:hypothetical protein
LGGLGDLGYSEIGSTPVSTKRSAVVKTQSVEFYLKLLIVLREETA